METGFNLYKHMDWQSAFQEWFEWHKLAQPSSSLQSLALQLGLKAKSHLHRLVHTPGKTLAPHLIEPLAKLMKLSAAERDYWEALVLMGRARTLAERNRFYLRLHKLQGNQRSHDLEVTHSEYFTTWYLPILREALILQGWNGDYARLGRWFEPPLREAQVKKGAKLLCKMGLMRKVRDHYEQTDAVVHTTSHAQELAVATFQREMLHKGEQALLTQEPETREVSSVTFSIPQAAFGRMQQIMREFQITLAQESISTPGIHDSVYQLNLQCFPVVQKPDTRRK